MVIWNRREDVPEIHEKIKKILMEKINEREPPNSIWLTDTVFCGRKKIFSILFPKMNRFNERQINRIWLGLIVGAELEKMGIINEVVVEYKGIRGRIDCILDTGEPVEIKVAGNLYTTVSDYAEIQVQQLSRYCLAKNIEHGILFYYVPSVKISNLPAYRYYFDLDKIKDETDYRIEKLNLAFKSKDPFILPATWHSNNFNNWECKECVYRIKCEGGGIVLNCKM